MVYERCMVYERRMVTEANGVKQLISVLLRRCGHLKNVVIRVPATCISLRLRTCL